MKIVVLGSSKFRKEKIAIKEKLNLLGHEAIIDKFTEKIALGEEKELAKKVETEHSDAKKEYGFIQMYYDMISDSDAVLVCNFDKGEIKNYIGANSFLEIGYAHTLKKEIYLLNPFPTQQKYILEEIEAMIDPENILNENLMKIPLNSLSKSRSLRKIAEESKQIEEEIGLNIDDTLNKLTQELGEFNDAIQKVRGKYCKQKANNLDSVKDEAGDLFFNLISVCNKIGVNPNELPKLAENTLEKLKARKDLYKKSLK